MESTFRLLRVRGIEIGANWSYLLIFGLITFSLANGLFPTFYEGLSDTTYWVMGIVTSLLFVISLLLHELGHAFRALKEGMEIEGITLWLLGGVAKFKGSFPSAGAEFRIAIAGPAVTVVLIVVFGLLRAGAMALGVHDAVTGVIDYLFQINLTLLVFNMIPALPLDGGRVLRSILWSRRNNFLQATVSSARIARGFAALIIGAGILLFISGAPNGLFLALVGWFILQAAQAEVGYAMFRQSLRGRTVGDLMSPSPETIGPGMSIAAFVDDVAARGHSTYPVVGPGGDMVGLMSLRLAAAVPLDDRGRTTVGDVMLREGVPVVAPEDDIAQAVMAMQGGPGRAVVVDGGRVVGIVSTGDVARAIELEQIRSEPTPQRRRSRSGVVLLVVAGLAVLGWIYHPPLVTLEPGTAFDVTSDITIDGVEVDDVRGEYLLTAVAVQQPNVFGFIAAVFSGDDLQPISALTPEGVDPEEYFEQQREVFREAQRSAAAAAAEAAGMDVEVKGGGARVISVIEGSPATDVLEAGDIVIEVDGEEVRFADDLSRAIRARPAGTSFRLLIERAGETREVTVRSGEGALDRAPRIGVTIATEDFEVDLPFEVEFRDREIGGPSAGLAYALAVYDLIDDADTAAGRSIATTGTIDIDGNVGAVGAVPEKAVAADEAGAETFLVPANEVSDVPDLGLEVIGVGTLDEALRALDV